MGRLGSDASLPMRPTRKLCVATAAAAAAGHFWRARVMSIGGGSLISLISSSASRRQDGRRSIVAASCPVLQICASRRPKLSPRLAFLAAPLVRLQISLPKTTSPHAPSRADHLIGF